MSSEKSQLRVRIYSARKLPEKWQEKELFVTMELGESKFKTASITHEANPKWNEECHFDFASTADVTKHDLIVTVVAKETFKKELGSAILPAAQFQAGLERGWYPLVKKGKPSQAELSYEVTLIGPAKNTLMVPVPISIPKQVISHSAGQSPAHEAPESRKGLISGLNPFSVKVSRSSSESEFVVVPAPSHSSSLLSPTSSAALSTSLLPEITGLSPNSGPETGDTQLTIRGDNLGESREDVLELSVCGVDCLSSLVWISKHKIFCTTRAGIGCGEGHVAIATRSGGRAVSTLVFTFIPTTVDEPETPTTSKRDSIHIERNRDEKDERDIQIQSLVQQVTTLKAKLKERDQDVAALKDYIDLLLTKILDKQPSILEEISKESRAR